MLHRTKLVVIAVVVLVLCLAVAGPAFADNTPPPGGRPNQSCGSTTAPNTPGNAVNAPGAAFNPGGQAGSVYAGQQPQNSNNGQASQYDVACFQNSQPHP